MDKNEILEKSRREYYNKVDDERDIMVNLKARSWGLYAILILGIVTFLYNRACRGLFTGELFILLWGYLAVSRLYRAVKDKEKGRWANWGIFLLTLCFLVNDLVVFFAQG